MILLCKIISHKPI